MKNLKSSIKPLKNTRGGETSLSNTWDWVEIIANSYIDIINAALAQGVVPG